MKEKLLTIMTVILIGVLLVLLQSCKKDDVDPADPSGADETAAFRNKISQTWKVNRVTVDDIDVTGSFKTMTIMFRTDKTYSVTNPVSPLWPASGTYEVIQGSNGQNSIKRSDGVTIDVIFLSDSSVILELLYTSQSGRVDSVTGKFKFEMSR